jgi:aspartate racemase
LKRSFPKKTIATSSTRAFSTSQKNVVSPPVKARYLRIVDDLVKRGVEGVILGCTEIPLVVKPEDVSLPLFDTTLIHATAAVDFALGT